MPRQRWKREGAWEQAARGERVVSGAAVMSVRAAGDATSWQGGRQIRTGPKPEAHSAVPDAFQRLHSNSPSMTAPRLMVTVR